MKTAISLPDELFRRIDARARALKVSRSAFLARAARMLLAADAASEDPTTAWNRAIDEGGQPTEDPAAAAIQRRSKAVIRGAVRTKRRR